MNKTLYQIHLSPPFCCKRGVRYRELGSDEVHEIENEAAASLGKNGTAMALRNETLKLGVRRMLVGGQVTTTPVETLDGLAPEQWHTITLEELELSSSQWCFEKLFGAKDQAALERHYTAHHEVTQSEVEEIQGKAVPVMME